MRPLTPVSASLGTRVGSLLQGYLPCAPPSIGRVTDALAPPR
jgi:hypothetical protein